MALIRFGQNCAENDCVHVHLVHRTQPVCPFHFRVFIISYEEMKQKWISLSLLNLAFSRSATTLYLQQCKPVCGLNEYTDHDLFYTLNLDRPLTFRFLLKARHIKGIHIFPERGSRSFGCNTQISPCVNSLKQGVRACTWVCMRACVNVHASVCSSVHAWYGFPHCEYKYIWFRQQYVC